MFEESFLTKGVGQRDGFAEGAVFVVGDDGPSAVEVIGDVPIAVVGWKVVES